MAGLRLQNEHSEEARLITSWAGHVCTSVLYSASVSIPYQGTTAANSKLPSLACTRDFLGVPSPAPLTSPACPGLPALLFLPWVLWTLPDHPPALSPRTDDVSHRIWRNRLRPPQTHTRGRNKAWRQALLGLVAVHGCVF